MNDEQKVEVLKKFLNLSPSIRASVLAGYALGKMDNALENKGD